MHGRSNSAFLNGKIVQKRNVCMSGCKSQKYNATSIFFFGYVDFKAFVLIKLQFFWGILSIVILPCFWRDIVFHHEELTIEAKFRCVLRRVGKNGAVNNVMASGLMIQFLPLFLRTREDSSFPQKCTKYVVRFPYYIVFCVDFRPFKNLMIFLYFFSRPHFQHGCSRSKP